MQTSAQLPIEGCIQLTLLKFLWACVQASVDRNSSSPRWPRRSVCENCATRRESTPGSRLMAVSPLQTLTSSSRPALMRLWLDLPCTEQRTTLKVARSFFHYPLTVCFIHWALLHAHPMVKLWYSNTGTSLPLPACHVSDTGCFGLLVKAVSSPLRPVGW